MRIAGCCVAFVVCIGVLSSAVAQQSSTVTPSFKARTDVVLIPVIVRDSSGAPVMGLSKNDFTVFENGKRQTLSVFQEVRAVTDVQRPSVPNGVYTNIQAGDTEPQRITIVALDLVNTSFPDQAYARYSLLKFLSQNLDNRQPVALVAMNMYGLRMLHDFSADNSSLIAALKGVTGAATTGPSASGRVDRGVDSEVIKAALTAGNINADPNSPRVRAIADDVERILSFESGEGADDEFTVIRRNMLEVTLESLQHLAQSFVGIPGKKSLIWITGGFPFNVTKSGSLASSTLFSQGATNVTRTETRAGVVGHLPDSNAILQDDAMRALEPLYVQTLQVLASANIAVYPVDAAGLIVDFPGAESHNINLSISRESRERHQDVISTLSTFASMTGGTPCFNTNDLGGCFDNAMRDTETYYLMGYHRDQQNHKVGWRPLEVKVANSGLRVHARSGYFYSNENPSATNARQMDIALALSSPIAYTALPFTVKWQKSTEPAQKGKQQYRFVIHVPAAGLSIDDKNSLDMEFIAVAIRRRGDREDRIAQHFGIQLKPEAVSQMLADGLTYDNKLFLSPDKYMIHFVVRDNETGRTGSVIASVTAD